MDLDTFKPTFLIQIEGQDLSIWGQWDGLSMAVFLPRHLHRGTLWSILEHKGSAGWPYSDDP
jgi:hypothetical protein